MRKGIEVISLINHYLGVLSGFLRDTKPFHLVDKLIEVLPITLCMMYHRKRREGGVEDLLLWLHRVQRERAALVGRYIFDPTSRRASKVA